MVTLSDFNVSIFGNTASRQTAGPSSKCAILKRTTFIKLAHRIAGTIHPKMQSALTATRREWCRVDFFLANTAKNKAQQEMVFSRLRTVPL
jgi:hypothetical protein